MGAVISGLTGTKLMSGLAKLFFEHPFKEWGKWHGKKWDLNFRSSIFNVSQKSICNLPVKKISEEDSSARFPGIRYLYD